MRTVLAAVDFSEDSRRAAWRAALMAAEQRWKLELLHVQDAAGMTSLRDLLRLHPKGAAGASGEARLELETLAGEIRARSGVAVHARVVRGEVQPSVLAASSRAQLLVLGARGLNPLRDMILGTTSERLLGRCRGPVLVTRRPARGAYRRAMVAVDFSAHSAAALEAALRLAPEAHVTLVHAYGVPFEGKLRYAGVDDATLHAYRAEARRDSLARLLAMLQSVSADRGRISHAIAYGHPPRLLLDKARSLKADLVVIGKQGRSATQEWLLGRVTRHVLAGAKCDVLVVHQAPG